jgi:fatty acid desaturase
MNCRYRRQVATCLDIKPSYPILQSLHSWFFGGLDLHLVHHLFPRLSPEYYLQVTEIVKGICIRHCLPYQSAHMIDAQRLLFDRLSTMSTLFSLDPR